MFLLSLRGGDDIVIYRRFFEAAGGIRSLGQNSNARASAEGVSTVAAGWGVDLLLLRERKTKEPTYLALLDIKAISQKPWRDAASTGPKNPNPAANEPTASNARVPTTF